jgi:hypothetical protein
LWDWLIVIEGNIRVRSLAKRMMETVPNSVPRQRINQMKVQSFEELVNVFDRIIVDGTVGEASAAHFLRSTESVKHLSGGECHKENRTLWVEGKLQTQMQEDARRRFSI